MYVKVVCAILLLNVVSTTQGFNVGVKSTKCNVDPSKGEVNDPCGSLYDGVCKGRYCACPSGTHEDTNLKRCVPGEASVSTGGTQAGRPGSSFDDLPFDFPGPDSGSSQPKVPSAPVAPAPAPQPRPPPQPQPGQPQPGWNPNQPGYNPNQPGYNPNQPGYNPNQPGYNPNQPGYNPNQPGYNPNQPGYNPNRPGYNPNQPGYNPNQPGYNPNQRGGSTKGGGHSDVGEKAGGGVGGVIGLLLIGGLIYFCCCRGGKHKQVMNRFQGLPFVRGGQGGQGPVAMQSQPVQQDPNFGSQHTYVPPGQPGQYPPPQQPYPGGGVYPAVPYGQQPGFAPYPPQGYPADGQQPPPYTQQYQPNAPPP